MGGVVADSGKRATATAGLRGASWDVARLPPDLSTSVHALTTSDGRQVLGFLYKTPGVSRTVVSIMHPRELVPTHYLVPDVLASGCHCWVQGSRSPGNDLRLEHETALLDVAAGQEFLRAAGYEKRILLGNSGGAALFALYIQQSARAPSRRIALTPAGRPTELASAGLPEAQGLVLVSPHPGPGKLLQASIDPSAVDEDDALKTDDKLSPFAAANGYRKPPETTRYEASFIERYRAAQAARVARIDQRARDIVEERQSARRAHKAGGGLEARIRAAFTPIFHVWRTDADLRCIDLSIDPSDRKPGSLWGTDPVASNYGCIGFARSCTAESWLSSWSGISSNASFERCGGDIEVPTCMIEYSGDSAVFPDDASYIFNSIGAPRKVRHRVRGNHHGQPLEEGEPLGQVLCGAHVQDWLQGFGK
jgi:pimeloyl-ACP methyl ester carboxylesterase